MTLLFDAGSSAHKRNLALSHLKGKYVDLVVSTYFDHYVLLRLHCPVELGVGQDDERVVPSELELHAAVARGRLVADRVADRDGAREGDGAHRAVPHELRSDLRACPVST